MFFYFVVFLFSGLVEPQVDTSVKFACKGYISEHATLIESVDARLILYDEKTETVKLQIKNSEKFLCCFEIDIPLDKLKHFITIQQDLRECDMCHKQFCKECRSSCPLCKQILCFEPCYCGCFGPNHVEKK